MKKMLLVGKDGFIGSNLYSLLSKYHNVDAISYSALDCISSNYDAVINCSIHPEYKSQKYKEENDIDLKISNKFKCKTVMISSRKVYGSSNILKAYDENSSTSPTDYYGENKLITEQKIKDTKDEYLIFRASNIFGYEPGRSSFMGFCIDQLIKNNTISYEISKETKRDFLHVKRFSNIVIKSLDKNLNGLFNIGSNVAYEIGDVANNLILGYNNNSKFICTSNDIKDQFVLDCTKLFNILETDNVLDISEDVKEVGKQICKT